jgi:hypothetical protein
MLAAGGHLNAIAAKVAAFGPAFKNSAALGAIRGRNWRKSGDAGGTEKGGHDPQKDLRNGVMDHFLEGGIFIVMTTDRFRMKKQAACKAFIGEYGILECP